MTYFCLLPPTFQTTVSPVGVGTWQCQPDYPSLSEDPPDSQSRIFKFAKIAKFATKLNFSSHLSLQNTNFSILDI